MWNSCLCHSGCSNYKKLTENDINIKFKEGTLNLKIDKDLNIFMRGPVSDIKILSLKSKMSLFNKFKIGLEKAPLVLQMVLKIYFLKKKLMKMFSQSLKN